MLHRKKDPPRSADSTPDRGSPHKSSHSTLSPSAQIVADTKDNEVAGAEIEAASSSSGSRSSGEEAQDEKCYKTPGAMETHSASLVPCSATPSVDTAEIPNIKPASGISNRAVTQKRTLKKWRACFGDDVDETQEQLIVQYQCNLQQESILVPGSLYISHKHLCFASSLPGLRRRRVIDIGAITGIHKEHMLKISDNALAIETPADTLHFGSFISRNATYQLILDLWTAQAPEASREFIAAENQTQLGQEHDTASSPAGNTPRKATQCGTDPFEAICLDIRLPTTPEKVFGLMWRDENFIKSFWKGSQQLSDIDLGPWQGEGRKKRYYSYNKPLHNPVGPKSIHCNLSDEELNTDPETYYEVLTVTKTPAAPAGDIFQVKTKTAISWAGGAKGGSKLLVSTQCEWEGRHMLKGTISKAAVEGQRSYHKDMAKHMREYIKQHSIEFATGDVIDAENDDELEQTEKPDMLQRLRIGIMDVDDPIKLVLAILCVLLLLTTMHLHLSRPSGRSSHASPPLRSLSEDAELVGRVERLEMTLLSLKAALSDV